MDLQYNVEEWKPLKARFMGCYIPSCIACSAVMLLQVYYTVQTYTVYILM